MSNERNINTPVITFTKLELATHQNLLISRLSNAASSLLLSLMNDPIDCMHNINIMRNALLDIPGDALPESPLGEDSNTTLEEIFFNILQKENNVRIPVAGEITHYYYDLRVLIDVEKAGVLVLEENETLKAQHNYKSTETSQEVDEDKKKKGNNRKGILASLSEHQILLVEQLKNFIGMSERACAYALERTGYDVNAAANWAFDPINNAILQNFQDDPKVKEDTSTEDLGHDAINDNPQLLNASSFEIPAVDDMRSAIMENVNDDAFDLKTRYFDGHETFSRRSYRSPRLRSHVDRRDHKFALLDALRGEGLGRLDFTNLLRDANVGLGLFGGDRNRSNSQDFDENDDGEESLQSLHPSGLAYVSRAIQQGLAEAATKGAKAGSKIWDSELAILEMLRYVSDLEYSHAQEISRACLWNLSKRKQNLYSSTFWKQESITKSKQQVSVRCAKDINEGANRDLLSKGDDNDISIEQNHIIEALKSITRGECLRRSSNGGNFAFWGIESWSGWCDSILQILLTMPKEVVLHFCANEMNRAALLPSYKKEQWGVFGSVSSKAWRKAGIHHNRPLLEIVCLMVTILARKTPQYLQAHVRYILQRKKESASTGTLITTSNGISESDLQLALSMSLMDLNEENSNDKCNSKPSTVEHNSETKSIDTNSVGKGKGEVDTKIGLNMELFDSLRRGMKSANMSLKQNCFSVLAIICPLLSAEQLTMLPAATDVHSVESKKPSTLLFQALKRKVAEEKPYVHSRYAQALFEMLVSYRQCEMNAFDVCNEAKQNTSCSITNLDAPFVALQDKTTGGSRFSALDSVGEDDEDVGSGEGNSDDEADIMLNYAVSLSVSNTSTSDAFAISQVANATTSAEKSKSSSPSSTEKRKKKKKKKKGKKQRSFSERLNTSHRVEFSKKHSSSLLSFSNNRISVSRQPKSKHNWDTAVIVSRYSSSDGGILHWNFCIDKCPNYALEKISIVIGVAPLKYLQEAVRNGALPRRAWGMGSINSLLKSEDGRMRQLRNIVSRFGGVGGCGYGPLFVPGLRLGMQLNLSTGELSYHLADKENASYGIAHSDVSGKELSPFISIANGADCKVSVMPYSHIRGFCPSLRKIIRNVAVASSVAKAVTVNYTPENLEHQYPIKFLRKSYNLWKKWLLGNWISKTTIEGIEIELDASNECLMEFSERIYFTGGLGKSNERDLVYIGAQSRIRVGKKCGVVIGMHKGRLGVQWDGHVGVSLLHVSFLRKYARQNEFMVLSEGLSTNLGIRQTSLVRHEAETDFDFFVSLAINRGWSRKADAELSNHIGNMCKKSRCGAFDVTPRILLHRGHVRNALVTAEKELRKRAAEIGERPADLSLAAGARFALMLQYNLLARDALQFFDWSSNCSSVPRKMMLSLKHWLFIDVKCSTVSGALEHTKTPSISEDEFTVPSSIFEITIDRRAAAACKSNKLKQKRYSVFSQLRRSLDNVSDHKLRQSWSSNSEILKDPQPRCFKVKLQHERGEDNGGPYTAVFNDALEELQGQYHVLDLFVEDRSGNLMLNCNTRGNKSHLKDLHFLGIIIGIGYRCGIKLPLYGLPEMFWSKLVSCTPSKKAHFAMNTSNENFVADVPGEWTVPLVVDGAKLECDAQNLALLRNMRHSNYAYKLENAVKVIVDGVAKIVPLEVLRIFNAEEIKVEICGVADIDVNYLKSCAKFKDGRNEDDRCVQFLWRTLKKFTCDERVAFLKFVWERKRMPSNTALNTAFEIRAAFSNEEALVDAYHKENRGKKCKAEGIPSKEELQAFVDKRLPRSKTCFFQLELPSYSSVDILAERLRLAMNSCRTMDRSDG